jgi:crotonobetaine/carnitine-CoA ligase
VPSEWGEEEVMVSLVAKPGHHVDLEELRRHLEGKLPRFMVPSYLRMVERMPKTPTAKIEKHRLRAEGVTAGTWDREAHGITVRAGRLHLKPAAGAAASAHR